MCIRDSYLAITQDKDGHFKFVVAEGVNEPGPIFTFGCLLYTSYLPQFPTLVPEFEGGVLALKLGDQRGELRQVSAQRNGEHANAGFGFD